MTNHMYRILLLLLCIGSGYAQELPKSPISAGRDTEVAAFLLATEERLDLLFNQTEKNNAYLIAAPRKAPESGYCITLVIPIL